VGKIHGDSEAVLPRVTSHILCRCGGGGGGEKVVNYSLESRKRFLERLEAKPTPAKKGGVVKRKQRKGELLGGVHAFKNLLSIACGRESQGEDTKPLAVCIDSAIEGGVGRIPGGSLGKLPRNLREKV